MEAPHILLVEDEANLGSTLKDRLEAEGYHVTWSKTKEDALGEISGRNFELSLLDVGLPDGNGFEIAESIRSLKKPIAILFLTAFGDPQDRIRGLELGAEDYVVKPFHLKELLLRIRNSLKRSRYFAALSGTDSDEVTIGKAKVFFSKFEIVRDGEVTPLTHKECALLRLLFDRKGHVVSRDDILNTVWEDGEFPSSRTIDNFVVKLRKLIEPHPENPQVIRSIRGVGYQLYENT